MIIADVHEINVNKDEIYTGNNATLPRAKLITWTQRVSKVHVSIFITRYNLHSMNYMPSS